MNSLARTILVVFLILLLIGTLPAWPYSAGWGPYPAGGLGTILVVVVILLLIGKISPFIASTRRVFTPD